MGKKQSKEQTLEIPQPQKDDRWVLSRSFGPKYQEFNAKYKEIRDRPMEQKVPRPIHSSGYYTQMPQNQHFFMHVAIVLGVFRKLPFTNPMVRVIFLISSLDFLRYRTQYWSIMHNDDINQIKQFDLMFYHMFKRRGLRLPDTTFEWEDWYQMNKPAYRVAIPHEYALDDWMRFFLFNRQKYGLKPTQWHGEWEQEICLNMDLHAPHADHWLDLH